MEIPDRDPLAQQANTLPQDPHDESLNAEPQ
jgi:hypothetical protein